MSQNTFKNRDATPGHAEPDPETRDHRHPEEDDPEDDPGRDRQERDHPELLDAGELDDAGSREVPEERYEDRLPDEEEPFPERGPGERDRSRDYHRSRYPHQPPPYPPYPHPEAHGDERIYRKERTYLQTVILPLTVFALLLASWLGILMVLYSDTGSGDDDAEPDLRIEEVFFILEDIDQEQEFVTIDISLYITNYGDAESGEITLSIYAENKKNDLIYDRANQSVDPIDEERTVETIIPIQLPVNNSFRIRVYLFEDRMITITGYGEISLSSVSQTVVDFTTGGGGADEKAEDDGEGLGSAGAWSDDGSVCLVSVVVILIVVVIAAGATFYKPEGRGKP